MTQLSRPRLWSDQDWASLERLMEAEPSWQLPAYHPDLFGLDSSGVALASCLLDQGCLGILVPMGDGPAVVDVTVQDRHVQALFGRPPELIEVVGRFPDTPPVWRALALADVPGHRRSVALVGGELQISVSLAFRPGAGGDLLKRLDALAHDYRRQLDASPVAHGYADMLNELTAAGLPVPRIPVPLRHLLTRVDTWFWSTNEIDDERRLDHYLLESAPQYERAIEDSVTLSHGGHGMNSYALTWSMAMGPLAFVVQDGWGGAFGGAADNGRVARLFTHVGGLVETAERRMQTVERQPDGAWLRPVVVTSSPLRGVFSCRLWDPLRGERLTVDLDSDEPWDEIQRLIETAHVPEVGGPQIRRAEDGPEQ